MAGIGSFEIIGELGKGAGSVIYKIKRKSDLKVYALKVVQIKKPDDKKYLVQIEHENKVLSQLDHPYIVKSFGYETTSSWFRVTGARLLLELIDGQPLAEFKVLPINRMVSIFRRTAAAMAYLHQKGIYHADIKPENIMVIGVKEAKIIDFGLSWTKGEERNRVQGTLEFLAPEQANNKKVDAKTDIFNFGATMYRVLTGKPVPNLRGTQIRAMSKVDEFVKPLVELVPTIPPELDVLVRHCVRYNPKERPATMNEIADRLTAIRKSMGERENA